MNAQTLDISALSNAKLVKLLEKRDAALTKATDKVFACEPSNNVRFLDIMTRLGEDHPAVQAYAKAERDMQDARYEARRRVGPVPFDTLTIYISYLRNQKSRRKAA